MAADRLGVIRRFAGESLCDFQRGHGGYLGHIAAEEHVFHSRLGLMSPSAHRSPTSHCANVLTGPVAVKVGIYIWIGRAMDGGIGFEEAVDAAVTFALLEVFAVLPGEMVPPGRELEEKRIERSAKQGVGLNDQQVFMGMCRQNSGFLSIAFRLLGSVIWTPGISCAKSRTLACRLGA